MACLKCRGTAFEVYHEEQIHDKTPDEMQCYSINVGGLTRFRCIHCGLENSTIGIFR